MSKLFSLVVGSALLLPGVALAQNQETASCEALVNATLGPPGQAKKPGESASDYAH
jgi:hypothetical protein